MKTLTIKNLNPNTHEQQESSVVKISMLSPSLTRKTAKKEQEKNEPISSVILFNDDVHTLTQVVNMIVKATGFSTEKSKEIMLEAHNNGTAVVIRSTFSECLQISGRLQDMNLTTEIRYE